VLVLVFVAASVSAAVLLARASAVLGVAAAAWSPLLPFASPRVAAEPAALLPSPACSETPVSALAVPVEVLAVALPTAAAWVGTAPCAPERAASAACKASLTDFGSADAAFFAATRPAMVLLPAPAPATAEAASVSEVAASVVPWFVALLAFAWACNCACTARAAAAAAASVDVVLPVFEVWPFCFAALVLLVPLLPALCCVLPEDEAEPVWFVPVEPLALFWLLLADAVLLESALLCCEVSAVAAAGGALCCELLAFWALMLCCKV